MWGKAGVEFITSSGQKISSEIIPVEVLVTDVVEEGSLGMGTTFCCRDQANVEPLEALPTLTPVRLSQTQCSGGEDVCRITLPSMRVFQLLLPGCNHSFSRHANHPIPTGSAADFSLILPLRLSCHVERMMRS